MLNKRMYIKPVLESETFVPQNYIAACGEENKVYLFTCDGGGGADGGVWKDDNGVTGLQTKSSGSWWDGTYVRADTQITWSSSSYHACGKTHEAKTTDDFILNCWYKNYRTGEKIRVTVWRGPNGNNVHCTEQLDINSWTTVKS